MTAPLRSSCRPTHDRIFPLRSAALNHLVQGANKNSSFDIKVQRSVLSQQAPSRLRALGRAFRARSPPPPRQSLNTPALTSLLHDHLPAIASILGIVSTSLLTRGAASAGSARDRRTLPPPVALPPCPATSYDLAPTNNPLLARPRLRRATLKPIRFVARHQRSL